MLGLYQKPLLLNDIIKNVTERRRRLVESHNMGAWIGLGRTSVDLTMDKLSSAAGSEFSRVVSSFGDTSIPSGSLSPISSDLNYPGAPPPTPTDDAIFQWMDTHW